MPGAALLRARIFHQVRSLLLVIKLHVAQFFRSALNAVSDGVLVFVLYIAFN